MCFGLSCSQMQFNSNRTSLSTFIFPTPQGFLPSGVTKIHSLVQTDLTARSRRSELALRGLSFFKPSGFMLAHVFFIPLVSSFVFVLLETSSPSGLFTFVFELAHMALRWMNTVLAVCEYMSFAKSWQEKGCSSKAETWQVKNVLIKDFD